MAERNATRGLFRSRLKEMLADRDRLYSVLSRSTALDLIRPYEDDFFGPTIDSTKWTLGNGGGASAASPAISAGQAGGQCTFVTGTANDNTASSILVGGRHFTGDTNALVVARLKINTAVTSIKVEVGFKDNILTTAGNGAVVNSMGGGTFIATDGVCWCYDTNNAGTGWQGLGVANTVAATTDTGYNTAPTADTFEYLMLELIDGAAYFSRYNADGIRTYPTPSATGIVTSAVTSTVLLAPYIYVEARSATSKTVRVDMIFATGARSTTP